MRGFGSIRNADNQAADAKRAKLRRLLGMLGSHHDGEVLNAARAAERLRRELGLTWDELLRR